MSHSRFVALGALTLAIGVLPVTPALASAATPMSGVHFGWPDPIGGVCDGRPNLEYTPSGGTASQLGEGLCRTVVDTTGRAMGKAGKTIGSAAVDCAENTVVGAAAGAITGRGSIAKKAKKLAKATRKIVPQATAIECAHDVIR